MTYATCSFAPSCRYSGDYTDTGQLKAGQNNNGYVPNVIDYSPPSQQLLLRNGSSSNTASTDTSYYPNGQIPSVNSTLTRNNRTIVDPRQDNGLPNVHGSFNSLQNGLISEYQRA